MRQPQPPFAAYTQAKTRQKGGARRMALAVLMALALCFGGSPALADDLLLRNEHDPGFFWGLVYFGLTAGVAYQAQRDYQEMKTAQELADQNYALYQAATTTADALYYRDQTEYYHGQASWRETRVNLEGYTALALLVAGVYSWLPEDWRYNYSITALPSGILVARSF